MHRMHHIVVGDGGGVVLPADVRERTGIGEGTPLVLLEAPTGLVLLTRSQLRQRVRTDLDGVDLVGELVAERRSAAATENSARPGQR